MQATSKACPISEYLKINNQLYWSNITFDNTENYGKNIIKIKLNL